MDTPVAVVVCCRDRPRLLAGTLAALPAATRAGDEVIVVDSASAGDGVRATAAAAGVRVLRCPEPGTSRARNAGAAATSAPLLAFTDDDCRPRPGWTAALAAAFAADDAAFVTGRVVAAGDGPALSLQVGERPQTWCPGDDVTAMGHGANLAVRREAFELVGGFDEAFGPGARWRAAEDKDLLWRLLAADRCGRYAPDAVVAHEAWRGRWSGVRTAHGYGVGSGALAAKVRAGDPAAGRRLLRRALWEEGVRRAAADARAGYEFGAASCLAGAAGAVTGYLRARSTGPDRRR